MHLISAHIDTVLSSVAKLFYSSLINNSAFSTPVMDYTCPLQGRKTSFIQFYFRKGRSREPITFHPGLLSLFIFMKCLPPAAR